jgi:hypothetical protein
MNVHSQLFIRTEKIGGALAHWGPGKVAVWVIALSNHAQLLTLGYFLCVTQVS